MIWSKCRLLAPAVLALGLAAAVQARPADVLGPVMAGEFALQAGDLAQAAAHYLRAAGSSHDPGIAERATRIALLAGRNDLAAEALSRWRELAPDAATLPEAALVLALAGGDESSAREAVLALLRQPEGQGLAALTTTLGGARGAQRELAGRVLRDLFAGDRLPPRLESWLAAASLARRLEQPALAGDFLREALARFPDDPRARLLQADQLRGEGRDEAARAQLAALGDPATLAPGLRRAAARQFELLGDRRAAAWLLGHGPQDDDTLRQRARWLLEAGDTQGLAALHDEAAGLGDDPPPERRLLLGILAERLQRWSRAEAWYASVPEGPGRDQADLRRAAVLAEQGRHDEALVLLRSLRDEAASEGADGETVRDAIVLESELLEARGRAGEARVRLDEAMAVFESDPVLLYARAMLHERSDRVDEALADLRRILDGQPDSAQALNAYGYTLLERQGRAEEALPYLERALALAPDSAAVLDSLGWARFRLGQTGPALELLRQAWAREPMPEIAAHLGEVLWSTGQHGQARDIWRAGLRLSSDDATLNRTLDRLLENRTP